VQRSRETEKTKVAPKEDQDPAWQQLGWKVVESRVVFQGRFPVRVDTLEAAADGRRMEYTYLDIQRHAAAALAVTSDRKAVLTRQYRHPLGQVMLDLPGGGLGIGEDPRAGAWRELEEETGYRAKHLTLLGRYTPAAPLMAQVMHLFFATGLEQVGPTPDSTEIIQVELVPVDELLTWVLEGQVCDAALMLSVLLAAQRGWLHEPEKACRA
jgi:ADP-ribose pyrophosphatase